MLEGPGSILSDADRVNNVLRTVFTEAVAWRLRGGAGNPSPPCAALLAGGLHGTENRRELPPAFSGNADESDVERFPSTLRDAIMALERGTVARKALGDDVVDHYLHYARTEQGLFDKVVTAYERERLFERG